MYNTFIFCNFDSFPLSCFSWPSFSKKINSFKVENLEGQKGWIYLQFGVKTCEVFLTCSL